jgi:ribosome biogenesis SPOUT family RNA methylase Rps3
VDHPELRVNKHESTEMPFRYMKDKEGAPIMPEVSNLLMLLMSLECAV